MNIIKLLKTTLWLCLFAGPMIGYGQSYKVVCNKESRTVSVVPAQNRSANLVPLQGGFISESAAEKWIEANYQNRVCDPDQAVRQNQQAAQQQPGPPTPPPTTSTNQRSNTQPPARGATQKLRNTAIIAGIISSNLDEALTMNDQSKLGWQIGIEYAYGRQFYGGSGVYFQVVGGAFEEIPEFAFQGQATDPEPFKIYNLKIPFYFGRRSDPTKPFQTRVDVGVVWNTSFFNSNSNITVQGHEFKDNNFAFTIRGALGTQVIFLQVFFEKGLTDAFDDIPDLGFDLLGAGLGIRF